MFVSLDEVILAGLGMAMEREEDVFIAVNGSICINGASMNHEPQIESLTISFRE
jgi:hypothetical protein